MEHHEDLFAEFKERYSETGDARVPDEWPVDVRRRCLFLVKMLGDDRGAAVAEQNRVERSVVDVLSRAGVQAGLSLPGPDGAPPPAEQLSAGADRYVIEREIGRGGMGRVLLAYDREFRRRVAMKVLLAPAQGLGRTARFIEEAQATAQLEHPNIEPVHDLGLDPAGSPYFTMKWIRGRNLEEILLAQKSELSMIRLVQILQQVAMGIDFAHSRGVVHRDLKPQNVMVGDYGEVLIVDWGLAKVLGRDTEASSLEDAVSTARAESGADTLEGTVQGSIFYMAPEQARGEVSSIDARTDVFGLGAILYRILAGSPVHLAPSVGAALAQARRCEVVPPSSRPTGGEIPPELETICLKALAKRREDRFPTAREFHDALQGYVEGIHDAERRAAEALRLNEEAGKLHQVFRAAEAAAEDLRTKERDLRDSIRDYDPEEKKAPLWALLEEASAAGEEAERRFRETTSAYHAVLSIDPGNRAARAALAEIFLDRLVASEARGERDAARLYEGLAAQYQDGQHDVVLAGEGEVRLESDPPGAAVFLSRYEEKGLLLVESAAEPLGTTPLERKLPKGSYLAVLKKPGFVDVRYPFLLERLVSHRGLVKLHPEGSIPDGFIQIPAGESIVGGDRQQLAALPRSREFIPEFFVGRFPVKLGEYCAFLNERFAGVPAERDPMEVEESLRNLVPFYGRERYVVRGEEGAFGPLSRLGPRVPVMAIPRSAMHEYAGWLGRQIDEQVRLPSEIEWERCARGADARVYPWGNGFDWGFCKGGRSRKGEPLPEPVGKFSHDLSCFGVHDLAGSVREICDGRYEEKYVPCRGGAWPVISSGFMFRADTRTLLLDGSRATDIGFRVAYSST